MFMKRKIETKSIALYKFKMRKKLINYSVWTVLGFDFSKHV